jgi:hypothetical protein
LNKLLITIRGRTLILHYLIKPSPAQQGKARSNYIQVLPSSELARYDLKGLTPEMFCVNIADLVNFRGQYSGQVENERQVIVAKWAMNYEEYLQLKNALPTQPTHSQIVDLLIHLPGYMREMEGQYIEFEECVVPGDKTDSNDCSGYRLTLLTETVEGTTTTNAFYSLDTHTTQGWQDRLPPKALHESVQTAVQNRLDAILKAGVNINQLRDETDYAITP